MFAGIKIENNANKLLLEKKQNFGWANDKVRELIWKRNLVTGIAILKSKIWTK